MELRIDNVPEESRYEARDLDGALVAIAAYRRRPPNRVVFTHTVVEPAFEGQGVAGRLIAWALDDVRANDEVAVPLCPYVRSFIDKHPEYRDLAAPSATQSPEE